MDTGIRLLASGYSVKFRLNMRYHSGQQGYQVERVIPHKKEEVEKERKTHFKTREVFSRL